MASVNRLRLGVNIDHIATLRQARYATLRENQGLPSFRPDVEYHARSRWKHKILRAAVHEDVDGQRVSGSAGPFHGWPLTTLIGDSRLRRAILKLARVLLQVHGPRELVTTFTPSVRILIADDHTLLREGTQAVIAREPGWEVCGVASNGREAVAQAIQLKPDVVILDMTMPEMNGLDAAIQIKRQLPKTEIAMLSAYGSEELIRSAFKAGVKSFIVKTEAEEFLVEAVKLLARHQPFLTPRVAQILISIGSSQDDRVGSEPGERLTPRERQVMQLIAEGRSNKQVAAVLHVSVRTVENHRAQVLRKLNLDSVPDLVRYAIRNKMIEP